MNQAHLRPRHALTALLSGLALVSALTACNSPNNAQIANNLSNSGGNPSVAPTPSATPTEPSTDVTGLYSGPAEVAKYVSKFVDDAKIQGLDVTPDMSGPKLEIQIGSLGSYGSSTIGLCETGNGLRRVTFSASFWNSVDETQRELLAHHELGHCVLYRAHRSTVLSTGAYASIMYPIIMSNSTYLNNYDYYQKELFTWSSSNSANATSADESMPTADKNGVIRHICDLNELLPLK